MTENTIDYALAILDRQLEHTKTANSYEQKAYYEGLRSMLNICISNAYLDDKRIECDHKGQHHIVTK